MITFTVDNIQELRDAEEAWVMQKIDPTICNDFKDGTTPWSRNPFVIDRKVPRTLQLSNCIATLLAGGNATAVLARLENTLEPKTASAQLTNCEGTDTLRTVVYLASQYPMNDQGSTLEVEAKTFFNLLQIFVANNNVDNFHEVVNFVTTLNEKDIKRIIRDIPEPTKITLWNYSNIENFTNAETPLADLLLVKEKLDELRHAVQVTEVLTDRTLKWVGCLATLILECKCFERLADIDGAMYDYVKECAKYYHGTKTLCKLLKRKEFKRFTEDVSVVIIPNELDTSETAFLGDWRAVVNERGFSPAVVDELYSKLEHVDKNEHAHLTMHSELALLRYYLTHRPDVRNLIIGMSKLCCWNCRMAIEDLRGQPNAPKITMTGGDGKLVGLWRDPGWMTPDGKEMMRAAKDRAWRKIDRRCRKQIEVEKRRISDDDDVDVEDDCNDGVADAWNAAFLKSEGYETKSCPGPYCSTCVDAVEGRGPTMYYDALGNLVSAAAIAIGQSVTKLRCECCYKDFEVARASSGPATSSLKPSYASVVARHAK